MNKAPALPLEKYLDVLDKTTTCQLKGRIFQAIGLTIEAAGPRVRMGELCFLQTNYSDRQLVPAEVVGFKDKKILLMPLVLARAANCWPAELL